MAELARTALGELSGERGGVVFLGREARREPIEVSLKAAVADEPDSVHRAWVGTVDDVVVGYLVARIEDLADGRRLGVVEDVFVEEQARGIGIGEALMDPAIGWFVSLGCFGADAVALPGMRATKNFFETFGFTARLLVVHRRFHAFDPVDADADDAPA